MTPDPFSLSLNARVWEPNYLLLCDMCMQLFYDCAGRFYSPRHVAALERSGSEGAATARPSHHLSLPSLCLKSPQQTHPEQTSQPPLTLRPTLTVAILLMCVQHPGQKKTLHRSPVQKCPVQILGLLLRPRLPLEVVGKTYQAGICKKIILRSSFYEVAILDNLLMT